MLDVIYIVAAIALIAFVGLIAKGVEKLGPQPGGTDSRPTPDGSRR